jgi:hypothetical protein
MITIFIYLFINNTLSASYYKKINKLFLFIKHFNLKTIFFSYIKDWSILKMLNGLSELFQMTKNVKIVKLDV